VLQLGNQNQWFENLAINRPLQHAFGFHNQFIASKLTPDWRHLRGGIKRNLLRGQHTACVLADKMEVECRWNEEWIWEEASVEIQVEGGIDTEHLSEIACEGSNVSRDM
jgi:hypothetical protein